MVSCYPKISSCCTIKSVTFYEFLYLFFYLTFAHIRDQMLTPVFSVSYFLLSLLSTFNNVVYFHLWQGRNLILCMPNPMQNDCLAKFIE